MMSTYWREEEADRKNEGDWKSTRDDESQKRGKGDGRKVGELERRPV
jgi:hypothetical protein